MEFKSFTGLSEKRRKDRKAEKKDWEAREQLTNLMVEVFELRVKVREVLELVAERGGRT